MKKSIKIARYTSPAGVLLLGAYGGKIVLCDWASSKRREQTDRRIQEVLGSEYEENNFWKSADEKKARTVLEKAKRQLDGYFKGKRRDFDLPVLFTGTEFQCRVWKELVKIPYGKLISYGDLARRIGQPEAVRAVAGAVAYNPISLFVPCHRVVGSDRKLVGYGGGLKAKQFLLNLEFGNSSDFMS